MDKEVIELASELIRRKSITPEDAGCQEVICQHLEDHGFEIEPFPFADVKNFWAKRRGTDPESPVFLFAGHTDVVPFGPGGNNIRKPHGNFHLLIRYWKAICYTAVVLPI